MLILNFCKEGQAYSDFEAEEKIKDYMNLEACKHGEVTIHVSTANIITAARALIADGAINHTEINFKFGDEILPPDKNGRLNRWPEGFCDHLDFWLDRILK